MFSAKRLTVAFLLLISFVIWRSVFVRHTSGNIVALSQLSRKIRIKFPPHTQLIAGSYENCLECYAEVQLPPDKVAQFLAENGFQSGPTPYWDGEYTSQFAAYGMHPEKAGHRTTGTLNRLNVIGQKQLVWYSMDLDDTKAPKCYLVLQDWSAAGHTGDSRYSCCRTEQLQDQQPW